MSRRYSPDPDLRTLAAVRNLRVEIVQHYEIDVTSNSMPDLVDVCVRPLLFLCSTQM